MRSPAEYSETRHFEEADFPFKHFPPRHTEMTTSTSVPETPGASQILGLHRTPRHQSISSSRPRSRHQHRPRFDSTLPLRSERLSIPSPVKASDMPDTVDDHQTDRESVLGLLRQGETKALNTESARYPRNSEGTTRRADREVNISARASLDVMIRMREVDEEERTVVRERSLGYPLERVWAHQEPAGQRPPDGEERRPVRGGTFGYPLERIWAHQEPARQRPASRYASAPLPEDMRGPRPRYLWRRAGE